MIDWVFNLLGWQGSGLLLLIVAAGLWYVAGDRPAKIVTALGLALIVLLTNRRNAEARRKVREYEADRRRIEKANKDRRESRDASRSGGLLDDDGHRRD